MEILTAIAISIGTLVLGLVLGIILQKWRDKAKSSFEVSTDIKRRTIERSGVVLKASANIKIYIDDVVEPIIEETKGGGTVSSQRINTAKKELRLLLNVLNEEIQEHREHINILIPYGSSHLYDNAVVDVTNQLEFIKKGKPEDMRQKGIEMLSIATCVIRKYHSDLYAEVQRLHKLLNDGLPLYSNALYDDMKP